MGQKRYRCGLGQRVFFSESFIVSGLTFRSLIHFEFFFFNDTATTEIYTLSLHDALPILFMVSFAMQKLLSFIRSHLFNFVFISISLGAGSKRILL